MLVGNAEIGAQVRCNNCYLICLRHLITSTSSQIGYLTFMCAQHVLSNHKYHDENPLKIKDFVPLS